MNMNNIMTNQMNKIERYDELNIQNKVNILDNNISSNYNL